MTINDVARVYPGDGIAPLDQHPFPPVRIARRDYAKSARIFSLTSSSFAGFNRAALYRIVA